MAFVEKYANQVDSLNISSPFHEWYAPSCRFYNTNGAVYDGGDVIWGWMRTLFGAFSAVAHDIHKVLLVQATAEEFDPARKAAWVVLETTTAFEMKSPVLAGEPIAVPRLLSFLVGKSEVEGQGTDGLQILQAKTWWDSGVFDRELARRKAGDGVSI